jgi:hypothetical protein
MPIFRVEIYDKDGKTIEQRDMDIPAKTVQEAMRTRTIMRLRQEIKSEYGFRVRRISDENE